MSKLWAIPTIHPALLMRNQRMFPAVVQDLKKSLIQPPERYILHPTLEQVRAFTATTFAFDIETNYPRTRDITMVGLSAAPYECIVVPWAGGYINELQRIFKLATRVITQNGLGFDIPYLAEYGVEISPTCIVEDTMLQQHLIQPDLPHDLTFIGSIFTSKPTWEFDRKLSEQLYNARDVDVTMQAWRQISPLLRMNNLDKLYYLVQTPLAKICRQMKDLGIAIDTGRIADIRTKVLSDMEGLEHNLPLSLRTHEIDVRRRVPAPPGTLTEPKYGKKGQLLKQRPVRFLMVPATETVVPWRSPTRISEYIYDQCKIPPEYDIKTESISTGKIALAKIARRLQNGTYRTENSAEVHTAITAISKLRQLEELESNFTQDEYTHIKRLHTNFNVHGTGSGRLSSSAPNLQNVPRAARYIYVPSHEGWSIVSIDYSGIENRITAYLAGDTARLARFDSRPGFSEHKYATSLFFGIDYDEVEKDNDRTSPYGRSKAIVHGSDRGEGARKIAFLNDIPEKEVKPLLSLWKDDIKATVMWQGQVASQAIKDGVVTNPFGRKAWIFGDRAYCVAPETRVLNTDLDWVPVGSLNVADTIIGFEEHLSSRQGQGPKYTKAVVTATGTLQTKRYEVVTDKGTVITTSEHGFAVRLVVGVGGVKRNLHRWIPTSYLKTGDQILWFGKPWERDVSREGGYLSGLLDGEGHLQSKQGRGLVRFTQNPGVVLDNFINIGRALNFKVSNPENAGPKSRKVSITVDSPRSALEVIGRLQPARLKKDAECLWNEKPMWGNTTRHEVATVQEVRYLDEGPVTTLTTDTGTLITEGLCSHNTQSISFFPQSTAADVIYRAMIGLMYERINWPVEKVQEVVGIYIPLPRPAQLLLQVHDELVFECPTDMVEEVVQVLRLVMEQPWRELGGLILPTKAAAGRSWAEVVDL